MTKIPFQSKFFYEYYAKICGTSIEIDFSSRRLSILNIEREIIETILFSKSIQHSFTLVDLLKSEHKVGDTIYAVYPDGFENNNWLWAGNMIAVL